MTQRLRRDDRLKWWTLRGWYSLAWAVLGVCPPIASVVTDAGTAKYWSIGLMAVLAASYALATALPGSAVRRHGHLAVLVLVLGAMALVRGDGAALFIVSLPHFWLLARSAGHAIALSAVAATGIVAGIAHHDGWGTEAFLGGNVVFTLIGWTAGALIGLGVHRLVEQSEERARRLTAELDDAQRRLAEAHRLQGATEERERLAREIHDTLAQGFASIIVLAEAARSGLTDDPGRTAQQLLSIENTARENFAEARVLVGSAPQSGLTPGSVATTLRRVLDRFAEDTGLAVHAELPDIGCDRPTRIALLRCTQESLANVRKHAAATTVEVVLAEQPHGIELEITDDGQGFVVEAAPGFGLNGMRRRLADLGGRLTVTSSVGDGTRILAMIPTSGQV